MRNKTDLIVIATAKAKPGMEDKLEQALVEVAEPTRAQAGCVEWNLYRAGATLIAFERWTTRAAHDAHLQGAHVARLMSRMADLLAEPPEITELVVVEE